MKKLMVAAWMGMVGTAVVHADVRFNGLYHNNTNLNAEAELVPDPSLGGAAFVNVQYGATNAAIYFLTDDPPVNSGETAVCDVVAFDNANRSHPARHVSTVVLTPTNRFHGTPVADPVTVQVWRATYLPPAGFTGTVYYAPRIAAQAGGPDGPITDTQYLLRSIGANSGFQWGSNDFYWATNAQAIGASTFGLDYTFAWTSSVPYNYDGIYFNNPAAGLPQAEAVPGLPGATFLQWNYATNAPSYVHVLARPGQLYGLSVRFVFGGGPSEMVRAAQFLTNVVVDAGTPFHGAPAAGAITLAVWRCAFWPPAGWSNTVFYAPQAFTARDGAMWLVANLAGVGAGRTATNDWPVHPQYLYESGPFGRDWSFAPTAAIQRASLGRDALYHNNTNLNPNAETVPGIGSLFLDPRYGETATVFRLLTPHPLNLVPDEGLEILLRTSWTTNGVDYATEYTPFTFENNVLLDSGTPFHGYPVSGSVTLDLWRCVWPMPQDGGQPITNAVTIFYAPLLRTTVGSGAYQTDYAWLLSRITAGGPGYGTNAFPAQPQLYGADPVGQDYTYVNLFNPADPDGDQLPNDWEQTWFGGITNGTASADDDGDRQSNLEEYIALTSPQDDLEFFDVVNAAVSGGVSRLDLVPAHTSRVYGVFARTNLVGAGTWTPVTGATPGNGGVLSLSVTNAAGTPVYFRAGVRLP